MARPGGWKKLFGRSKKPTVEVQVGDKAEVMTETQAYRFDELAQTGNRSRDAANDNPLEQSRYSLEEAAFRLMTSEAELVQRAAAGSLPLYTNAAGLTGRWRRIDANGEVVESSVRPVKSGCLRVPVAACKELALEGSARVTVLEYPADPELADLKLEHVITLELAAWGNEKKVFCLDAPQRVDLASVVLLPPLV